MTNSIIINEKVIYIITKGTEKHVAIKPICEAIGVDYSRQLKKIKEDEILYPTMGLTPTVGADGKERKMQTIPLMFVFGWLFTINPENVKPEIKHLIIQYKKECYIALFDSFTKRTSLLKEKTKLQIEIEDLEEDLKTDNRYIKIQELKSSIKMTSQQLNNLDKNVVNEQLDLFKNRDSE